MIALENLDLSAINDVFTQVTSFNDLVCTPFQDEINAICWKRELKGNFAEIVDKLLSDENVREIQTSDLIELNLSKEGQIARDILMKDMTLLENYGALPCLNIIKYYDRDQDYPFFPTDVYSYHVDRSQVATDTFLCTYYGESSEILQNAQAVQKILVPEIREELEKLYTGPKEGFESFLDECFFDLHYQALPNSLPISLGIGNMWRLAVDHPESKVLPCVHRAPLEKKDQSRLLLIC